jgi:hypothetical protein
MSLPDSYYRDPPGYEAQLRQRRAQLEQQVRAARTMGVGAAVVPLQQELAIVVGQLERINSQKAAPQPRQPSQSRLPSELQPRQPTGKEAELRQRKAVVERALQQGHPDVGRLRTELAQLYNELRRMPKQGEMYGPPAPGQQQFPRIRPGFPPPTLDQVVPRNPIDQLQRPAPRNFTRERQREETLEALKRQAQTQHLESIDAGNPHSDPSRVWAADFGRKRLNDESRTPGEHNVLGQGYDMFFQGAQRTVGGALSDVMFRGIHATNPGLIKDLTGEEMYRAGEAVATWLGMPSNMDEAIMIGAFGAGGTVGLRVLGRLAAAFKRAGTMEGMAAAAAKIKWTPAEKQAIQKMMDTGAAGNPLARLSGARRTPSQPRQQSLFGEADLPAAQPRYEPTPIGRHGNFTGPDQPIQHNLFDQPPSVAPRGASGASLGPDGKPLPASQIDTGLIPTRTEGELADALTRAYGISTDQAQAVAAIAQARAETWAKATGRTVDEWYETKLAGVERVRPDETNAMLFDGNKGSVQFLKDGRAIIRAYNQPDVSTAVHELAHIFRRDMIDLADMAIAAEWAGAKGGKWTVAAEEKFARAFEKWLKDGAAPIPELQRVFEQMRDWMVAIYSKLVHGGVDDVSVSPQMREVFERLLDRGGRQADNVAPTPRGEPQLFQPSGKKKPVVPPVRVKVDQLQSPPPGEPISPLAAYVPETQAIKNLEANLNLKASTGVPKNPRMSFKTADGKRSVIVGDKSFDDWTEEVTSTLTPKEIAESRAWYRDLHAEFQPIFGYDTSKMLMAWLASQQNVSPSGGMLNMLRALDAIHGLANKKGGLAHDKMLAILAENTPDKGLAQKLLDFADAGIGKRTRTYTGSDPRGGGPFVADIHTGRDRGFTDHTMLQHIVDTYGHKGATLNGRKILKIDVTETAELTVAGEKQNIPTQITITYQNGRKQVIGRDLSASPSDGTYTGISKWGNELVDHLNAKGFDGGGWTADEAQAVGWMRMLKSLGREGEGPQDIIQKNVRNISTELAFGSGSRLETRFPSLYDLPYDKSEKITREVIEAEAQDIAAKLGSIRVVSTTSGPGGYMTYPLAPSMQIRVLGSPETARTFAEILGKLNQQTEVYISRPNPKGKRKGFAILQDGGPSLQDPAVTKEFWDLLSAKVPKIQHGFQPLEGGKGILIVNDPRLAKWTSKDIDQFVKAADEVAQDMGLTLRTREVRADLEAVGNNYGQDQTGRGYARGIGARGRPDLLPWVDGPADAQAKDRIREAFRRHAPDELAAHEQALKDRGLLTDDLTELFQPNRLPWEEFDKAKSSILADVQGAISSGTQVDVAIDAARAAYNLSRSQVAHLRGLLNRRGIRNAHINQRRGIRGVDPVDTPVDGSKSWATSEAQGKKRYKPLEYQARLQEIVDAADEGGSFVPLSDAELAVLNRHLGKLDADRTKIISDINAGRGVPEDLKQIDQMIDAAERAKIYSATDTARALGIMRMTKRPAQYKAPNILAEWRARLGRDLKPEERARGQKLGDEHEALAKQIAEAERTAAKTEVEQFIAMVGMSKPSAKARMADALAELDGILKTGKQLFQNLTDPVQPHRLDGLSQLASPIRKLARAIVEESGGEIAPRVLVTRVRKLLKERGVEVSDNEIAAVLSGKVKRLDAERTVSEWEKAKKSLREEFRKAGEANKSRNAADKAKRDAEARRLKNERAEAEKAIRDAERARERAAKDAGRATREAQKAEQRAMQDDPIFRARQRVDELSERLRRLREEGIDPNKVAADMTDETAGMSDELRDLYYKRKALEHDIRVETQHLNIRREYERAVGLGKTINVVEAVWDEIVNTFRSLKATGDWSMLGLQGAPMLLSNPKLWARTLKEATLQPMTEAGWQAHRKWLLNHPMYDRAAASGVKLQSLERNIGADVLPSTLIENAPVLGSFNRSYAASASTLRMHAFEDMVQTFTRQNGKPPSPRQLKMIANQVNTMTGFADAGSGGIGAVAKKMAFAANYAWSMFESSFAVPAIRAYRKGDKDVGAMLLAQSRRMWGVQIGLLLAAQQIIERTNENAVVHWNPFERDFGYAAWYMPDGSRRRLLLMAPQLQQPLGLLAKMAYTQETQRRRGHKETKGRYSSTYNRRETIGAFGGNKVNPALGVAEGVFDSVTQRKKWYGKDMDPRTKEGKVNLVVQGLAPISWYEMYERASDEQARQEIMWLYLLSIPFAQSGRTMDERSTNRKSTVNEDAWKKSMPSSSTPSMDGTLGSPRAPRMPRPRMPAPRLR